jgi:hypothetical protein
MMKRILFGCMAALLTLGGAFAADDVRTEPLQLMIIVDGSPALSDGQSDAVTYIEEKLLKALLQAEDSVAIWLAGDSARLIYQADVTDSASAAAALAALKAALAEVPPANQEGAAVTADFTGALKAAGAAEKSGGMTYTVLIAGKGAGGGIGADAAALLKYSMTREHAGWQEVITSQSIAAEARTAAAPWR